MRYSRLFGKTSKTVAADADSINARLLTQGGFIDQHMAGVYTYLPLGLRVLDRIKDIIREEMDAIDGQEVLMPALQPKEPWLVTGRWDDPGPEVMYRVQGRNGKEYGLAWSHEEVVTPLAKKFIRSYKDLPFAPYQIQNKFRNEPRAKSGLLRGREFVMKDMYSFHANEEDFKAHYAKAIVAYHKIFNRCGIPALYTEASGGAFSEFSHEYQVLTESGEDIVFYCGNCEYAQNREISKYKEGDDCPKCDGKFKEGKAIEVGNIFELKTRFTEAFDVTYMDEEGKKQEVLMGCYGIGPSRVMGTIVEVHNDENGIKWPKSIAPYPVHLIGVFGKDEDMNAKVAASCEKIESELEAAGIELIYDDRGAKTRAGEKFADADLIGLPVRLVVSPKTLDADGIEWKARDASEAVMIKAGEVLEKVQTFLAE